MDELRVGQVGLGWFGSIHQQAWAEVPGIEMVAVCDLDPDALHGHAGLRPQDDFHVLPGTAAGTGTGSRPAFAGTLRTQDIDEVFAAGIDLLDIVVTEVNHAALARIALEHGVDVIVEKPLALTPGEVHDLYELADRLGRNIYVGHVLRFDPRYVAMHQERRGGELRHLSFERHFQSSALAVYGRVHPVVAAAIHDIDVAVWLTDRRPQSLTAFGAHFSRREHPDVLTIVLRWSDGLTAVVQNSWHLATANPYGFVFAATIHTSEQTFVIRNEPDLWVWGPDRVSSPDLYFWPELGGARAGALVNELRYFADCAAAGRPSVRPPAEHVRIVADISGAVIESLARDSCAVAL